MAIGIPLGWKNYFNLYGLPSVGRPVHVIREKYSTALKKI